MTDSDKKYRIGLIGNPIAHSRSPRLFSETFADRVDVLDRYSYDLIEEADFDTAYSRFLADYLAVNVTAPFKTCAFEAADIRSEEASLCGAANLLVKEPLVSCSPDGGLVEAVGNLLHTEGKYTVKAYNTDCLAVKKILIDNGFRSGDTAYVYGCGGAGRAAAVAALMLGMTVYIYNRTRSKAEYFINSLCKVGNRLPDIYDLSYFATASALTSNSRTAVIYTLPVSPDEVFDDLQLAAFLESLSESVIIEADYKNPHLSSYSSLSGVQSLSKRSCIYISGLEWLRLQALATYGIVIK